MKKNYLLVTILIFIINFGYSQTITLAPDTAVSGNTTGSPLNAYYSDIRFQTVYTKSEINSQGITGAKAISSLSFYIDVVPSGGIPNFEISLANTTSTNSASHDATNTTSVYSVTSPSLVVGWNTFTFSTSFIWNGVDNILVNTCASSMPYTTPYGSIRTYVSTSGSRYKRADKSSQCGVSTTATLATKPHVKLLFTPPPSCIAPSGITFSNQKIDSVDVSWSHSGATFYRYEYGITGFSIGSGIQDTAMGLSKTLSGLSPNTTYDFYIKAICSLTDSSSFSGPFSFTTLCSDTNVGAWMDDVEGHPKTTTSAAIANCWSATKSGSSFEWEVSNSGTTPSSSTGPSSAHSGSNFFFTEASSSNIGDTTILVSPSVDLSSLTTPFLEFYYHMYGSKIGTLNVEVFDGTSWTNEFTISGAQQASSTSDWTQQYVDLSSYTGVIKLRFVAIAGGHYEGDISIDDIAVIESPSCFKPFDFIASQLFYDSAVLDWNQPFGSPSQWLVEYDTAGFTLGTGNVDSSAIDSIGIGGLVQKTTYEAYLKANCGAGDSSDWVGPFLFKTLASCLSPIKLNSMDQTDSSVNVYWEEPAGATQWEIEYGLSGFTQGTGTSMYVSNDTTLITGLMGNTGYNVYVRAVCTPGDTSEWTGPLSFTTLCSPDVPTYVQDFTSFIPICWERAKGPLTPLSVLTGTYSEWVVDGFGNVTTSGAARMNIYSTNKFEWLISNPIDLGNGSVPYQLEYDIALTSFSGTTSVSLGSDDSLVVVISTDNGLTWSSANALKTYSSSDQISNTGERAFIDLSAYSGVVKFGFYATSTVTNVDINVFIDNFMVTNLCQPSYDTIADTLCTGIYTSVTGKVYTTSGTYMDTLQKVRGCDSIIVTQFVNNITASTISPVVCDSFVSPSSTVYTSSATFTDILTNSLGCDSLVTVNLTVNKTKYINENKTACDSFKRPGGLVVTTSGIYTDTLTTASGCDSVIITSLVVNNASTSSIIDSACGSYTSPSGKVWTVSGTKNDTIPNVAGCDSVITINFKVKPTSTLSRTEVACHSYKVPETGSVYTVSGTYYDTTTNAFGCDNIITTNLTINTVSAGTVTVSAGVFTCPTTGVDYKWVDCDNGYSFILGETNQTYTPNANGNYACIVTSSTGCKDTSACVSISNVSLDEYELNANDIIVSPNPARGYVTINILNQNSNEDVMINLYDVQGKIVHSRKVSSMNNNFTLDLEGIEEGIYTLSFSNDFFALTKKLSVIK